MIQYHEEAPAPREDGHFIRPSASFVSLNSRRSKNTSEIEERTAHFLSEAASQASIAASSIVNSGGSMLTAVSTAKAAAQSILTEALDAKGRPLFNRRKAKQQAEIVATMAIISVRNSMQSKKADVEEKPHTISNADNDHNFPQSDRLQEMRQIQRFNHEVIPPSKSPDRNASEDDVERENQLVEEDENMPVLDDEHEKHSTSKNSIKKLKLDRKHMRKQQEVTPRRILPDVDVKGEDPIYYSTSCHEPKMAESTSRSSDEDSLDYGAENIENATNVNDPFLSAITNIFLCGFGSLSTKPNNDGNLDQDEKRNDDDTKDVLIQRTSPSSQPIRSSSTDAAEILRQLRMQDMKSHRSKNKSSKRSKMESAVLHGLRTPSSNDTQPTLRITGSEKGTAKDGRTTTPRYTPWFRSWFKKRNAVK